MAYDVILTDYVDAESAARSGGFEPYRYECARCWEEVRLCAADSKNQATHFRHRSGNNNIECENYLGNHSLVIHNALSRRNARDKIELYFSNATKTFNIGIKFNAEEISAYEQLGASFQIRSSIDSRPTISVPIKNSRFLPDVTEFIPINEFSWEYYITSTNVSKQRKYEMFRKDRRNTLYPSFFKIQAHGDDDSFQAKLVRTEMLYTNTTYLIIFTHQYYTLSFQNDVQVDKVFTFRTMNRDFAGVIVMFTNKTERVERQLEAWKYKLETNEMLTLLWPPSPQINDAVYIKTNFAYIFSSFELQAHGNINVHSEDISRITDNLTKVTVKPKTKIYKNNVELMLEPCEQEPNDYINLFVSHRIENNIQIADDASFIFNRSGVLPLKKGANVQITPKSEVRHYSGGYLDEIIVPPEPNVISGENLLKNALIYYKRVESFDLSVFKSLNISQTAIQYLENCEKTGIINSAVKRFIEEGRI
jgi:hypothetical protein